MSVHKNLVPNFIEARSPQALRSLMIKKNIEKGVQNQYFDIGSYVGKSGKLTFIAWYYSYLSNNDFVSESINE